MKSWSEKRREIADFDLAVNNVYLTYIIIVLFYDRYFGSSWNDTTGENSSPLLGIQIRNIRSHISENLAARRNYRPASADYSKSALLCP